MNHKLIVKEKTMKLPKENTRKDKMIAKYEDKLIHTFWKAPQEHIKNLKNCTYTLI